MKTFKKALALILAVISVFSCFAVCASAAPAPKDYEYSVTTPFIGFEQGDKDEIHLNFKKTYEQLEVSFTEDDIEIMPREFYSFEFEYPEVHINGYKITRINGVEKRDNEYYCKINGPEKFAIIEIEIKPTCNGEVIDNFSKHVLRTVVIANKIYDPEESILTSIANGYITVSNESLLNDRYPGNETPFIEPAFLDSLNEEYGTLNIPEETIIAGVPIEFLGYDNGHFFAFMTCDTYYKEKYSNNFQLHIARASLDNVRIEEFEKYNIIEQRAELEHPSIASVDNDFIHFKVSNNSFLTVEVKYIGRYITKDEKIETVETTRSFVIVNNFTDHMDDEFYYMPAYISERGFLVVEDDHSNSVNNDYFTWNTDNNSPDVFRLINTPISNANYFITSLFVKHDNDIFVLFPMPAVSSFRPYSYYSNFELDGYHYDGSIDSKDLAILKFNESMCADLPELNEITWYGTMSSEDRDVKHIEFKKTIQCFNDTLLEGAKVRIDTDDDRISLCNTSYRFGTASENKFYNFNLWSEHIYTPATVFIHDGEPLLILNTDEAKARIYSEFISTYYCDLDSIEEIHVRYSNNVQNFADGSVCVSLHRNYGNVSNFEEFYIEYIVSYKDKLGQDQYKVYRENYLFQNNISMRENFMELEDLGYQYMVNYYSNTVVLEPSINYKRGETKINKNEAKTVTFKSTDNEDIPVTIHMNSQNNIYVEVHSYYFNENNYLPYKDRLAYHTDEQFKFSECDNFTIDEEGNIKCKGHVKDIIRREITLSDGTTTYNEYFSVPAGKTVTATIKYYITAPFLNEEPQEIIETLTVTNNTPGADKQKYADSHNAAVISYSGNEISIDAVYMLEQNSCHHKFVETVKEATCTEYAETKYTCSICEYSYSVKGTTLKGHTYKIYATNTILSPTCAKAGQNEVINKCSSCGAVKRNVISIPSTGHEYELIDSTTTKATCVATGYATKVYACTKCDDVRKDVTTTPAYGHSYSNFKYNNDATYEKDGTKTGKCTRCGASTTVQAPGTKLKMPKFTIGYGLNSKDSFTAATLPGFDALKNVPLGGTVTGYQYRDKNGKTINAKPGDKAIDGTSYTAVITFAIPKSSSPIVSISTAVKVLMNSLNYSIWRAFR